MKLKKALSLLILFTFSAQSTLLAHGFSDITSGFINDALKSFKEPNIPYASSAKKTADSIRMKQRIFIKDHSGSWRERDIQSLYVGERFRANLFDLDNIKVKTSEDKKSFTIEQWGLSAALARHEFFLDEADGEIEEIVYDKEFLRLITSKGKLFSIYMPMANSGLFNHAVPLVLNLEIPPEANDQQQTHLFLVSRARKAPEISQFSSHFFTTEENRENRPVENTMDPGHKILPPEYRFEAGDQLLISDDGTALGHYKVDLLKTQYLYALEIVKIRATHGIEQNKALSDPELASTYSRLKTEIGTIDTMQFLLRERLAKPEGRDIFFWREWAPTFNRISKKAREILDQLKAAEPKTKFEAWARSFKEPKERRNFSEPRIAELEEGIAKGDLRNFWQYILETPEKNENLINWVLEGNRKYIIAACTAAAAGLTAFVTATSSYRNWGPEFLRPFSDLLSKLIPDVILKNPPSWDLALDYSLYLVPASLFLFMMSVPLMQTIGATAAHFMGGKNKGVDFKLGLGTVSMRGYSYITPAWYLSLASFTKRFPTFFTPIAAGFSPNKAISPQSPIGKRLGLDHEIKLGELNESVMITAGAKERAISLRNRAIGELILNKERGMSLAMLIGISQLSIELKIPSQEIFEKIKMKSEDGRKLDRILKERIALLGAGVESLCDTDFYFPEISELSAMNIFLIEEELKTEIRILKSQSKLETKSRTATRWILDNAVRRGAAWGLEAKEILGTSRMTQSIADQTWMQSRTDLVFGIFLTDLYGGRANYNNVSQLAADPRTPGFLFASGPNVSDSFEQTAIYAIATGARTFMMWFIKSQLSESSYQPLDTVELKIANKSLNPLKEATAAVSELFSLEGATLFSKKMWLGSVTQRIEFLWASMLLGLIPRIFLAGAPVDEAFMGSLQSLLLSVGFNMFWWVVTILNFGVEGTAADNAEKLRSVLVDLKRSIEMEDKEAQTENFKKLKELYSIVPEEMQENYSAALEMLNPGSKLNTEDLKLKAEQSKDQLLHVWQAIEVLKNQGLTIEEITKRYKENNKDPLFNSLNAKLQILQSSIAKTSLPAELEGDGNAEKALKDAQKNPPVFNKSNWIVPELNVWIIGAIGSGVVGSYIIADSYSDVSLPKLAIIIAVYFPALFAMKSMLTKGLPHLVKNWEEQTFLKDNAEYGREEALRRAAERKAQKLAKKMNKSALPNPLHACKNAISALIK